MSNRQCAHCPWRKDVVPSRDIPNGYSRHKHCALQATIAKSPEQSFGRRLNIMACHESPTGAERPCVGWAVNQIGPGNNIGLRLLAMNDERFSRLETVGEQHACFEDTLKETE